MMLADVAGLPFDRFALHLITRNLISNWQKIWDLTCRSKGLSWSPAAASRRISGVAGYRVERCFWTCRWLRYGTPCTCKLKSFSTLAPATQRISGVAVARVPGPHAAASELYLQELFKTFVFAVSYLITVEPVVAWLHLPFAVVCLPCKSAHQRTRRAQISLQVDKSADSQSTKCLCKSTDQRTRRELSI